MWLLSKWTPLWQPHREASLPLVPGKGRFQVFLNPSPHAPSLSALPGSVPLTLLAVSTFSLLSSLPSHVPSSSTKGTCCSGHPASPPDSPLVVSHLPSFCISQPETVTPSILQASWCRWATGLGASTGADKQPLPFPAALPCASGDRFSRLSLSLSRDSGSPVLSLIHPGCPHLPDWLCHLN